MGAENHLKELQENFSRFLYTARPTPEQEKWIERFVQMDSPSEAQSRLRIYRKNLTASLTGVLRAAYPVTERILTNEIFKKIAREYIYEYPSTQHDLNRYGNLFADFLDKRGESNNYPFISDLARLEWGWSECLDSREDNALSPEEFEEILKTSDPAQIVFKLRKSAKVVTGSYAVMEFWMECRKSEERLTLGKDEIPKVPQRLLFWKECSQRKVHEIENNLWPIFAAVQNGSSLKELLELPVIQDNPQLLSESLQTMLTRGWLSQE